MVLESVISPWKIEKKPIEMLLVGFSYSTIGLLLALLTFGKYASLAGVFITTIPLVVIMTKVIRFEEEKDLMIHKERFLIKEHGKALSMFLFLFIGMLISYSFWFTILPEDLVKNLFSFQTEIIESVQKSSVAIGKATQGVNELEIILLNNLTVLTFCILFSFLYGAGAIFILTLNASVIGVAVGSTVRHYLAICALQSHLDLVYNYFNWSISIGICYMIHGLFEISAYFIGALAGGIISVAVVNHDFKAKEFRHILVDSLDLLIFSILILFLGGVIEVFITPLLC